MQCLITDVTGAVKVQVIVKSVATGQVVATITPRWWWGCDSRYTPWTRRQRISLPVALRPGSYEVLIAGTTHDAAGNLWQSAVCNRYLQIR